MQIFYTKAQHKEVFPQSISLGVYEISSVDFTSDNEYMIVTFETGSINLYKAISSINKSPFYEFGSFLKQIRDSSNIYNNFVKQSAKFLQNSNQDDCLNLIMTNEMMDGFDIVQIDLKKDGVIVKKGTIQLHQGSIVNYNIHISQKYLLVTTTQNQIEIFNLVSCMHVSTLIFNEYKIGCFLSFDHTGLYLALATSSSPSSCNFTTLRLYEVGTGTEIKSINTNFDISEILWSPDGRLLYVSRADRYGLQIYQNTKEIVEVMYSFYDQMRLIGLSNIWDKFALKQLNKEHIVINKQTLTQMQSSTMKQGIILPQNRNRDMQTLNYQYLGAAYYQSLADNNQLLQIDTPAQHQQLMHSQGTFNNLPQHQPYSQGQINSKINNSLYSMEDFNRHQVSLNQSPSTKRMIYQDPSDIDNDVGE